MNNTGPGGSDRPNLVAGQPLTVPNPSMTEWFNVNAFTPQATGPGTSGRNTLFGPHYTNTDFSVFKTFPLSETFRLQYRTEFFNLFNHPNFGNPNASLGNPKFGTISAMAGSYSPRQIQFAVKLLF